MYTDQEVRWLLENYLSSVDDSNPYIIIRMADLKVSYLNLAQKTREILFMCGVQGLDKNWVAWLTDSHRTTVYRQYKEGIRSLCSIMNGGDPYGEA